MRVLLVEDDPDVARAVIVRLQREAYVVDHAPTLGIAVEAVIGAPYRLVLLDRRLPDGDGLALLPLLRTRPTPPPAIVLTARDDVPARVEGLDAGADDYLVKPFSLDELLARMRVLARRAAPEPASAQMAVGALRYVLAGRSASVAGRDLPVPRRELALLDALIRRLNRVVLREHLESAVYGFDDEVGPNALEAQVSRLRRRLADAGAGVEIHGVRGVGYMLRAVA